ncbi:MAG: NAD(P)-dependent alcohol dehydrogenase [Candidatus Hydrogenedentes bacterium]|nr:NAD(P)-dependent alcohol dehydrogenase [Candidatus Hydrogenedentota bacterium]
MKAIVYTEYGAPDVLSLREVEKPVPGDGEVLVRVHATTVTATDCIFRRGDRLFVRSFTGLLRPKNTTPGDVFAGVVEDAGKNVRAFTVGEAVYGTTYGGFGAHAEYLCVAEGGTLAPKPANVSYGEAAAVCDGALTALPFLRDTGNIQPGQKVLIIGASGGIGTFAVQLAKHFGAEVTGVCSTGNVDLVKSLGADIVIDYLREDFTEQAGRYDLIFDTVGKAAFSRSKGALKPNGVFLEAAFVPSTIVKSFWTSMFGKKKLKIAATGLRPASERVKDLQFLKGLVEAGTLRTVVDRRYRFNEMVEAHRYVDTGHKKGNVVIELDVE